MKKYYQEIFILSFLAIAIGILAGSIDALFGIVLNAITEFRTEHFFYLIPFLAPVGIFIAWSYKNYSKNSSKGMGLIFSVGQGEDEEIPKRLIPFSIISTWLTHLFGGSAGREGVAVQLGATISDNLGQSLGLKEHRKSLIIIGMAAGFAGLFQTPIAAAFFALEVIVAGKIQYRILLPTFIASFFANYTAKVLGSEKFVFTLDPLPAFDYIIILKIVLAAICFGLVGYAFSSLLAYAKMKFAEFIPNPILKIAIGGVLLSILMVLLYQGRYSGLGTNLINEALKQEHIYSYDFLLKLLLTIFTLAIGFQGGEVTPLFAIGASLGAVLAPILGLPVPLLAALGYSSVFASATNTYLAPILIGGEVFGFNSLPFFVIAVTISYTFNFNKSIYGVQRSI